MDQANHGSLRPLLAQLVRSDVEAPSALANVDPGTLLEAAAREGVTTQVYRALTQLAVGRELLETFRGAAVSQAGSALMLRRERERVLTALGSWSPIVLKGEVLARLHYPEYPDRPMGDMDVLIRADHLAAVGECLAELGYRAQPANRGSLVMPQQSYQLKLSGNVTSVVDMHTALFNRPAMRDLLGYTELQRDDLPSKKVPRGVITPSVPHQLIHGALHLLGHHGSDQRLIWLLDLHLLAGALDAQGADIVMQYCRLHGLSASVARALESAAAVFPLDDTGLLIRLQEQSALEHDSRLNPDRLADNSPLQQARDDWRSLAGTGEKLTWLRQHLFPRAAYMKSHYSLCRTWSLPLFYLWRILRGAVKLLRPR